MEVDPQRRQPTLIGVKPDGGGSAGEAQQMSRKSPYRAVLAPGPSWRRRSHSTHPRRFDLRARDAGRADMERMSSSACSPFDIGIHQAAGRRGHLLITAVQLGMQQIERGHVERGGYHHTGCHQRKAKSRPACP